MDLNGTTWIEQARYSDGSSVTTTLAFKGTKATFVTEYTETDGSSFKYPEIVYTYTRSKNLVVFSPIEDGKATLEGLIEEDVKMTITNMSNGEQINIMYRK